MSDKVIFAVLAAVSIAGGALVAGAAIVQLALGLLDGGDDE